MCRKDFDAHSDPLIRARLTPEELESLDEDESEFHDYCMNNGKDALVIGWEGNFPGACGMAWLKEFRGLYIWGSSDDQPWGPYESLSEALDEGVVEEFCSNHEVDSAIMSDDELKRFVHGRFFDGSGNTIVINSKPYRWTEAGFERCDWSERERDLANY